MALAANTRKIVTMTLMVVAMALVLAGLDLASMASVGFPLESLLPHVLSAWLPWVALSPVLAWLGVTFRLRRGLRSPAAAVHLIATAAILPAAALMTRQMAPTSPLLLVDHEMVAPPPEMLEGTILFEELGVGLPGEEPLLASLLPIVPAFALITFVLQALLAFGEIRDRRIAEARLREELSRSQLAALRSQVNPHFLFNTLNSVNALMRADVTRARRMLADLAALLRSSFRDPDQQEVELGAELELAERYAAIQAVRFEDRMRLEVDVPAELHGAMVPTLSLQPLIENSVIHAIEKVARPCTVRIVAARDGDTLRLEVSDDGPGPGEGGGAGIGLSNTRQRLQQLYGEDAKMEAQGSADGFRVLLALPYRTQGGETLD